jgi:hypothetical protein
VCVYCDTPAKYKYPKEFIRILSQLDVK